MSYEFEETHFDDNSWIYPQEKAPEDIIKEKAEQVQAAITKELEDRYPNDTPTPVQIWEVILNNLDLQHSYTKGLYTIRNEGHGPIYMDCAFHEEKTPSLALFNSGNFLCHGCGENGDMTRFILLAIGDNLCREDSNERWKRVCWERSLGTWFYEEDTRVPDEFPQASSRP